MDANEILAEIERLEQGETTYANCTKLAVLYTIKEHLTNRIPAYSHASSEFLLAVSDAPIDKVLNIMDEHMECIKLLYPKEYTSIIRKIKN